VTPLAFSQFDRGAPFGDGVAWAVHQPDNGVAIQTDGKGGIQFTVQDDGLSWWVDKSEGRTCQRAEIADLKPLPAGPIDMSYRLRVALTSMVSADQAYICLGQIQNVDLAGDAHTSAPAWLKLHGRDATGKELLSLVTDSEAEGQRSFGPFAWDLSQEILIRLRALVDGKRGQVTWWVNGTRLVNEALPLGFIAPHQQIRALGIYTGEAGLPVGSGRAIHADYRGVQIGVTP
jgi:hypothetical protein